MFKQLKFLSLKVSLLSEAISFLRVSFFSWCSCAISIEIDNVSFLFISTLFMSYKFCTNCLGVSSKISWQLSPSAPILLTQGRCSYLAPYSWSSSIICLVHLRFETLAQSRVLFLWSVLILRLQPLIIESKCLPPVWEAKALVVRLDI